MFETYVFTGNYLVDNFLENFDVSIKVIMYR